MPFNIIVEIAFSFLNIIFDSKDFSRVWPGQPYTKSNIRLNLNENVSCVTPRHLCHDIVMCYSQALVSRYCSCCWWCSTWWGTAGTSPPLEGPSSGPGQVRGPANWALSTLSSRWGTEQSGAVRPHTDGGNDRSVWSFIEKMFVSPSFAVPVSRPRVTRIPPPSYDDRSGGNFIFLNL